MALLPATIFLFTLIPFIPIPNFQLELIKLFESIFPVNAYHLMENTIIDIVTNKSGGLLLVMFFATIIFSTNGIHAVLHAFVVTSHSFKPRSWVNQRKVSVLLLLIGILMIAAAGMLIIFGKSSVNRLVELEILEKSLVISILVFLKWIVVILLLFVAISFLYYLAPAKRHDFRFVTRRIDSGDSIVYYHFSWIFSLCEQLRTIQQDLWMDRHSYGNTSVALP